VVEGGAVVEEAGLSAARGRALAGRDDLAGADTVPTVDRTCWKWARVESATRSSTGSPSGHAAEGLADHVVGAVLGPSISRARWSRVSRSALAGLDPPGPVPPGLRPRGPQHLAEHLRADPEEHEEGDDAVMRIARTRPTRRRTRCAWCLVSPRARRSGSGSGSGTPAPEPRRSARWRGWRRSSDPAGSTRWHATQRPGLPTGGSVLGLEASFGALWPAVTQVLGGTPRLRRGGAFLGAV